MLNKNFVEAMFYSALKFELQKYSRFDVVYTQDKAPETGKAIYAMYQNSQKYNAPFYIFNGANEEENLYFTPETNLLYRTLHDFHHAEAFSIGAGGTTKIEDELRLNCKMAFIAFSFANAFYDVEQALQVFFAVYHDTVGQVHYYAENKDFVTDQKSLTISNINACEGVHNLMLGRVSQAKQVMLNYMIECGFIGSHYTI